jgi:hypothetical protein
MANAADLAQHDTLQYQGKETYKPVRPLIDELMPAIKD